MQLNPRALFQRLLASSSRVGSTRVGDGNDAGAIATEQITDFLGEAEGELTIKEQCRRHGFSKPTTTPGRLGSAA